MRKYRNQPVETPDGRFDSKGELARWGELKLLELSGAIRQLDRQVRIPLLCGDRPIRTPKGRRAVYVADFTYFDCETGRYTVEDFKGARTRLSDLKMAIVQAMEPTWKIRVSTRSSRTGSSTR